MALKSGNGSSSRQSSYSTTPSDQISAGLEYLGLDVSTSGAVYRIDPVTVLAWSNECASCLATPKSASLHSPFVIKILSGFMSRCKILRSCKCLSAYRIYIRMLSTLDSSMRADSLLCSLSKRYFKITYERSSSASSITM